MSQSPEVKINTDRKEEMSDEKLAALAAGGDTDAFEILFKRFKGLVISEASLFYIKGGEYEDILQEGNIGLLKAIRTYSEDKGVPFSSFASLCIRGRIINAVKNASRKKNLLLSEAVSLEERENLGSEVFPDPEGLIIEKEDLEAFSRELTEVLTPLERKVLFCIVSGNTYKETGEKLGIDKKAVDNARSRIKKKMILITKNIRGS